MRYCKTIILLGLVALMAACQTRFEESYDSLKMSSDSLIVSSDAGKFPVTVYYSGKWSASPDGSVSWAELSDTRNEGVASFKVAYSKNEGPSRMFRINIKCDNGDTRVLKVTQKGRSGVSLVWDSSQIEFPAESVNLRAHFNTTLTRSFVEQMMEELVPDDASDWIHGISLEMDENPLMARVEGWINLAADENTTGVCRRTELRTEIVDALGIRYGENIQIVQDSLKAWIAADSVKVMRKYAATATLQFDHNLGVFADSIKTSVSFQEGEPGFISNLKNGDRQLTFDVSQTDNDRRALVTLSCNVPGAGIDVSCSTEIRQTVSILKREVPLSMLINAFSSGKTKWESVSEDYDDYITLYVVGGANPNMEENINTAPNTITTSENDRTFYVQDAVENPSAGFRVQLSDPEGNRFAHGDKIELVLTETSLLSESEPLRRTIGNVAAELIETVSSGNVIVPVERTLATLGDEDVYTYCKVDGLEFQVKQGSFTNVREYDAILNPLNEDLNLSPKSVTKADNQFAKDGSANLLFDSEGHAVYMLVNMGCAWRRPSGETVPQGVGSVAGVIVHKELPRWGGNVGRYSIRPLSRDDIDISPDGFDSPFSNLAEWVLTKGNNREAIINDYNWLGGYAQGLNGTELNQNKLLATGGPQTESAVLYSENLRPQKSTNATLTDPQYPITAQSGYRGLDVSNPDSAPMYGMSKGSVISFSSNPAGWLQWDDDKKWTGGFNGIVMEFSTTGVNGSLAAVGFNIAGGRLDSSTKANAWGQHISSFPVYWKVEMQTSDDGGSTWSEPQDAVNQATGLSGFEMRTVPFAADGTAGTNNLGLNYYNYLSTAKTGYSTPADCAFGIVTYRYTLPSTFFGHSRVRVRILPTSDVIASMNEDWTAGIASQGIKASLSQKQNVHSNILLEDVYIQYK